MKHFYPADILIPDFSKVDGTKWATVACDQFTGEPEYWNEVEKIVADSESTFNLMIPEAFLSEVESRKEKIHLKMKEYLDKVLIFHENSMIYVERTQSDGKVRRGLVGAIDLEDYDYREGSGSLIRATEGTVLERIPPRIAVRRKALIEMPHIMMLINDREDRVFSSLDGTGKIAYEFPLMLGGGCIKGRFLTENEIDRVSDNIERLAVQNDPEECPLLFAVGDGNHSLATAKAAYEEIKSDIGEDAKYHPARYALVEIVNLYDKALTFEPIYRILNNCDPGDVIEALKKYSAAVSESARSAGIRIAEQKIECIAGKHRETVTVSFPIKNITVATLQDFLDRYVSEHSGNEIDYIHGKSSLISLAERDSSIGFIFDGITKDGFFNTIIKDGAFPRKTFSIGHAKDKRYYIECRKIVN